MHGTDASPFMASETTKIAKLQEEEVDFLPHILLKIDYSAFSPEGNKRKQVSKLFPIMFML